MGQISHKDTKRFIEPFNNPIEIGLRALAILNESFPNEYSLLRLVIYDYLIVHSDDIQGGPVGLHPQTPHRSGELLIKRDVLQKGLFLYQSRGLIEERYQDPGIYYTATERSASFLDALSSEYVIALRDRALWLVNKFIMTSDPELLIIINNHIGKWGTEFTMESVLWLEE